MARLSDDVIERVAKRHLILFGKAITVAQARRQSEQVLQLVREGLRAKGHRVPDDDQSLLDLLAFCDPPALLSSEEN